MDNCDLAIHLFQGYDWLGTRTAIHDEVKTVRRRLQKIRQVMAKGQAPDETVEEASATLFASFHIGLPNSIMDLGPDQVLAALDEADLTSEHDSVSQADSWQTLPPRLQREYSNSSTSSKRFKRDRLARGERHAIVLTATGLQAKFESFASGLELDSMTNVTVNSFEIVDNLKTSTWSKFLNELRVGDGGVVRPTGAPMVRFELRNATATSGLAQGSTEAIMKVRLA